MSCYRRTSREKVSTSPSYGPFFICSGGGACGQKAGPAGSGLEVRMDSREDVVPAEFALTYVACRDGGRLY